MISTTPPNEMSENEQILLLKEAFESFNTATAELQQSYDELKGQVNELNLELDETNKKLKKNLKEKEELKEYLQNVLENAPNGVVVIDNMDRVKFFNKAAEEITGFKYDDIADKEVKRIFPGIDKVRVVKGKASLDNYEVVCSDSEKRTLNIYISNLKEQKRKVGKVIAFEDITGIKRLEEQVQRKNRLEAMGEMAAGISHEIRNPLGAIELFASVLRKDIKGESEKEELVDNIISGVKSLSNITSNLLLFTRDIKPKMERVSINKVIDDALIFTEHAALAKSIKLNKAVDKSLSSISLDQELIKQVLLNLILNAVQAIKKPGEIEVSAEIVKDVNLVSLGGGRECIHLAVQDDGPGISKTNLEKIFNPFHTTKRSGLGLGLAIVHKIIASHNGIIEVSSSENSGAKFSIFLPLKQ